MSVNIEIIIIFIIIIQTLSGTLITIVFTIYKRLGNVGSGHSFRLQFHRQSSLMAFTILIILATASAAVYVRQLYFNIMLMANPNNTHTPESAPPAAVGPNSSHSKKTIGQVNHAVNRKRHRKKSKIATTAEAGLAMASSAVTAVANSAAVVANSAATMVGSSTSATRKHAKHDKMVKTIKQQASGVSTKHKRR